MVVLVSELSCAQANRFYCLGPQLLTQHVLYLLMWGLDISVFQLGKQLLEGWKQSQSYMVSLKTGRRNSAVSTYQNPVRN